MKKALFAVIASFLPTLALAGTATNPSFNNFTDSLQTVNSFINTIIPFIIGLAVLFFIFSIFKFVTKAGDPDARKEARDQIIYGVIIIAVMLSVWGLINFVVGTFGLSQSGLTTGTYPSVPDVVR